MEFICANLVETNTGMETAKRVFYQEKLDGDRSRFCGISEHYGLRKPGMPFTYSTGRMERKKIQKLVLVDILCKYPEQRKTSMQTDPRPRWCALL